MSNAAAPLRRLGSEASTEREVFLLSIDALSDFPTSFGLSHPRFVLLLMADFSGPKQNLSDVANRVVDAGCGYFCAWGPGCELIHEEVDLVYAAATLDDDDQESVLMTTDHADDSIDDAVFFAVVTAMPVGIYAKGCNATIIVVVDSTKWLQDAEIAAKGYLKKHAI